MKKQQRTFAADFETTVYEGQTRTDVWAAAIAELYTEKVSVLGCIDDFYALLSSLKENVTVYFHNEKFDGSFIIDFLINKLEYDQAFKSSLDPITLKEIVKPIKDKDMPRKSFKYLISSRGQWYYIIIKTKHGKLITIKDSVKLLPFTLRDIGESFQTEHRKLTMEYEGYRYPNCPITTEEKEYIINDVLVLKEALEITFEEGHKKLTIGSCCMAEFKSHFYYEDYDRMFPDLYNIPISEDLYEQDNAGDYIRKSYRGAWCYLVPEKASKIFHNGLTVDVNSLYPSQMHSDGGRIYPVGLPNFWCGNYIPDKAIGKNKYFFIRILTAFEIKEGYLPTIQVKHNLLYPPREFLKTSNVIYRDTGEVFTHDSSGNRLRVKLTLTMTDYYLIKEHYNLIDCEILSGCYFYAEKGIFDDYINKYKQIKMNSKGAKRTLAKLYLNNLYGKLAASTESSFKLFYKDEEGNLKLRTIEEYNRKGGYIPCGTAITSYARDFTIRSAQKNYHGAYNRGFIYADTDSIHCDLSQEELIDIPIHETDFNHWSIESEWSEGIFIRPKTYIENIDNRYHITCAGLPDNCKNLLEHSIEGDYYDNIYNYNDEELEFVSHPRTIKDFKVGIKIPSKLMPKRIDGGILLVTTDYEMR